MILHKSWRVARGALLAVGLAAGLLGVSPGQAWADVVHEGGAHAAHGADAAHSESADAHGGEGAHGHGHVPHFSDINWFHGFLGEKEGVEPSLLWRKPGTPVPLGALLLNTAVLFALLAKLGGPKIREGLIERKKRVVGGMESAAAMKAEAEEQLAFYEGKLTKIDSDIERIRTSMREQSDNERKRIMAEAEGRRAQLEREARLLIEQELKVTRETLFQATVLAAMKDAESAIAQQLNAAEQQRLADEFLANLDGSLKQVNLGSRS